MQEPTFEGSLKRLEEIVSQLEGNTLDLEQSLEIFEEGVKLVRFCAGRLDEAERRIEILLTDKEGRLRAEPFPEEPEAGAGESERP
ncbi:MAG TPA: exodeoxyribonuclease VII small subunit [Candidatus Tectomicrobia bacterium]|jgi:exodeoxyribonuclease VII small subunit|nr:exodeoxyribonuclease VII small subunit [Candidatus Tectomicrobia bacterium]